MTVALIAPLGKRYDPLGKCNVTPAAFAAMTRMLMSGVDGAGGRVALFLEGGYHLTALADSAFACTHALLGDEYVRQCATELHKASCIVLWMIHCLTDLVISLAL